MILTLNDLPNGSLILYRKKVYFISDGIEGRVVTDKNGHWTFLKDLNWRVWNIIWQPGQYYP